MPELPEVDTIKTQLKELLPFVIDAISFSNVATSIIKKEHRSFDPTRMTINGIDRHGKMLIFQLNDLQGRQHFILSHLGMSGSWRISKEPLKNVKHVHIILHSLGQTLSYVDPRRFGNMYFVNKEQAKTYLEKLGVDIAGPDFTSDYVHKTLKAYPNRQLKPFLLDQAFFAGSGNYIACEICARAGIRPTRRAKNITKKECEKIVWATKSIIQDTLKTQGMTFSGGYKDAFGEPGLGVQNLVVFYQKTCRMCGKTPVKKIVLSQRGTYYCPKCQK